MAIQRAACWLTLRGIKLDPAHVSSVLSMQPDSTTIAGQQRFNQRTGQSSRPFPDSTWSVESERHVAGNNLDDHFCWLMSSFDPANLPRISNLESVWLTVFIDGDHDYEGFSLDRPVVEFAAALRAEVHVYCSLLCPTCDEAEVEGGISCEHSKRE